MKQIVSYRQAIADDIHFLLKLRKDTMDEHLVKAGLIYNDAAHLERIYDHFDDSLIILVEQQLAGLLKLGFMGNRIHIRQIQISPQFQNQGLGRTVINDIIGKAKGVGLPVTLNVLKQNPARLLYQRAGFSYCGETDIEYQMRYEH